MSEYSIRRPLGKALANPASASLSKAVTDDLCHLPNAVDALAIIIACPLWPSRTLLNSQGQALHDAILESAKPYARALTSNQAEAALAIASRWTPLVIAFMEKTHINEPVLGENNRRMLAVYTHYMDQFADWRLIHA